ncbi:MAG: DegT/DnrJ/EryC1/StrS family aminotransferase [Deltaproteobacteria bacterium]|nr:DegT/DnrJ/EryC1/StrS family aminotransferase [Deltaproteobacteria bacterium]
MKVPLLDLKQQYSRIKDEIMAEIEAVCDSQIFILGPRVEELEKRVAEYCGARYAVGVSSGTDALLIALMAEGVGHGDMVITTPYSFFSTAGVIARLGAVPLFVDIDDETYNIDPVKLKERLDSLGKEQRDRIKAVIPVHLFGQCADMEPMLNIARRYGIKVIEDAAQAIGAEYEFGNGDVKRAGSMGDYGCFSFYPTKNLGAFGEGGMVTCNDEDLYKRLKIFRNHGDVSRYSHRYVGGNFRLDAIQASVLLVKLKYLDEWTQARVKNAGIYRELTKKYLTKIHFPLEKEKRHIYNQFIIKVRDGRDGLKQFLSEKGIGCEIYYPVPLHLQECFKNLKYGIGDLPVSENAALNTLALPVYPELTREQLGYVVDSLKLFESSGK